MDQRKLLSRIEYSIISTIIIIGLVAVYLHYKSIVYWEYTIIPIAVLAFILVILLLRFKVTRRVLKGRLKRRALTHPRFVVGEAAIEMTLFEQLVKKRVKSLKGTYIVFIGDKHKAFIPVNSKWDFITMKVFLDELRVQHGIPIAVHHDPRFKGYLVNEMFFLKVLAKAAPEDYYIRITALMSR